MLKASQGKSKGKGGLNVKDIVVFLLEKELITEEKKLKRSELENKLKEYLGINEKKKEEEKETIPLDIKSLGDERLVSVSVKHIRPKFKDFGEWEEKDGNVYIGRHNHYVGATKSKWSNKFSAKKYGREGCVKLYKEWLINESGLLPDLEELRGKTLGCWCSPELCHGNVLLDLLYYD